MTRRKIIAVIAAMNRRHESLHLQCKSMSTITVVTESRSFLLRWGFLPLLTWVKIILIGTCALVTARTLIKLLTVKETGDACLEKTHAWSTLELVELRPFIQKPATWPHSQYCWGQLISTHETAVMMSWTGLQSRLWYWLEVVCCSYCSVLLVCDSTGSEPGSEVTQKTRDWPE